MATTPLPVDSWGGRDRGTGRGGATVAVSVSAVLSVRGAPSPAVLGELGQRVHGLLDAGIGQLVLDLSATRIRPRLWRELSDTYHQVVERGGSLRLTGLQPSQVLPALSTATLEQAFLVYRALPRPHSGPHPAGDARYGGVS